MTKYTKPTTSIARKIDLHIQGEAGCGGLGFEYVGSSTMGGGCFSFTLIASNLLIGVNNGLSLVMD